MTGGPASSCDRDRALEATQERLKDGSYYIAEGYEDPVTETRLPIEVGRRYFFQPRLCTQQLRRSAPVNLINHSPTGLQVRVEDGGSRKRLGRASVYAKS